jgi:cytochrome c oxidase cbb3-type subunit III
MTQDQDSNPSKVKILDHDYDGIKELDNPLPQWWLYTFYIAIVFSAWYVYHYHVGNGQLIESEFRNDVIAVQSLSAQNANQTPKKDSAALMVLVKDATRMERAKRHFGEKCASCHMPGGEGSVGPNLTDKFWIHGDGSSAGLVDVITAGVPDKGMPPWGPILKTEEIEELAVYVHELRNNPKSGKAPKGKEIP